MQIFDVYAGELHFSDGSGAKTRPSLLLELANEAGQVSLLGIYSYRKWFNKKNIAKHFVEIIDLKKAGLKRRSFVELNTIFAIDLCDFKKFNYLGTLSQSDAQNIAVAFEKPNG